MPMNTDKRKGTDKTNPGTRRGGSGRTGPRTGAGKARSSRNALRHGLSARRDTPGALARHTEAALEVLAGLAAGPGLKPVPHDAMRERLADRAPVGIEVMARALAFVAADEKVQRARRAKREALHAAEGVIAFDILLAESYADIASGVDLHAHEGLDRRAVVDVKAERALEQLTSIVRLARGLARDGKTRADRPFGSPTSPELVERLGIRSASILHALQALARLDRYEARAVSARRKALRRLAVAGIALSDIPDGGADEDDDDEGDGRVGK